MITKRTKIQLFVFLAITLLGISVVGAKYAQLDRLVLDDAYTVTAHFADSGGVFEGAEVTYRGLTVGRVESMELTEDGVDVNLAIENGQDSIPAETDALVGNRSAVGEQYVELQPTANGKPYLEEGSEIEQSATQIPIQTTTWLDNTQKLVNSVGKQDLNTVVSEFGQAFQGSGEDLGRLIDSTDSFLRAADDNLGITRQLLRDSNTVLGTQVDKASAIRSFANDLAAFTDTLADSDGSLRKVIDNGSATATELRSFLEENEVDLGKLINNLVTTGEVTVKHLDGLRMMLIIYPYVTAGAFTVIDESEGQYYAHFGLVLTQSAVCRRGYESTDRRPPQNTGNRPMNEDARCIEPATQSNARGAQHSPRVAPFIQAVQPGVESPVIGTYDRSTQTFTWDDGSAPQVAYTGGSAAQYGDQSWMQMLLQPVLP